METELFITFSDMDLHAAGEDASHLEDHLRIVAPSVKVGKKKIDDSNLDVGTILTILLAGPAVVSLAKGIADWLAKQATKPKLILRDKQGHIILELENMPASEVRALLEGKLIEVVGR